MTDESRELLHRAYQALAEKDILVDEMRAKWNDAKRQMAKTLADTADMAAELDRLRLLAYLLVPDPSKHAWSVGYDELVKHGLTDVVKAPKPKPPPAPKPKRSKKG